MIPHLSPWIWVAVIATLWLFAALFALALGKTAGDADRAAARMQADRCPDEVEP